LLREALYTLGAEIEALGPVPEELDKAILIQELCLEIEEEP
jgi:hypothetical protein